jgi:nucleotide-binding universal stress UspA family protein
MVEFKRILVPLDGSALSEKALPPAMALAEKFEAYLTLLQVVDVPNEINLSLPVETRVQAMEQARRTAESYLKGWQEKLRRQGLKVNILVHDVSPADDIIETANTLAADIIVMGTHGRGGLARLAVGSVADTVMRHSPCPVLLVRQKPEKLKVSQPVSAVAVAAEY